MSDTKKDTVLTARPTLQLTKTVESGKVKQSFQHGRSKTVTVEVRKTRTFARGEGNTLVEVGQQAPQPSAVAQARIAANADVDESGRQLSDTERQQRLKLLKQAEEQVKRETEEAERRAADDAERKARIEEQRAKNPPPVEIAAEPEVVTARPHERKPKEFVDSDDRAKGTGKVLTAVGLSDAAKKTLKANYGDLKSKIARGETRRTGGKITVTQAFSMDEERGRSLASVRRAREKARKHAMGDGGDEKIVRDVVVPEVITVQELAQRMAERGADVVKVLMKMGVMATVTQTIDADTAELVVSEFGHNIRRVSDADVENVLKQEEAEEVGTLKPRGPVVTIMGHVDHGKTSLLDALRKTDVAAREAGGITQHIGAYQVQLETGQKITFLDTPGHEAFTAMRARGAKVTDIVVLVVAADDGIMEQTREAINHAKAAGVPIIVAVNKIDKPGADIERIKSELMNHELVAEDFGGEVMVVPVSAKQGTNLEQLKETIIVQSEVLELKANPDRSASGAVIEAKIDRGRGVVATLLVQKGTLKVGDIVVAGAVYGRVRALIDDKNKSLESAGPSMPVEILGLNDAPMAGDEFDVVESEKIARDITEYRSKRDKAGTAASIAPRTAENLFGVGDQAKEMPIIIKADVHGSVEAISGAIAKLSTDEVSLKVIHSAVGGITESDVSLAMATGARILAFNVRANPQAKEQGAREKVDIRYYSVIYDIVDDAKALLGGMLSPVSQENFLGYAEIRQVFTVTKAGKVAGCYVTSGIIKRSCKVRLLRDNVVIHEGTLKTLKRFKDDVREVKEGFECGMAFENYDDIREKDVIEAFEVEEVARTL